METYGAIYRTKRIYSLNVPVAIITARYDFIEGGDKGYVIVIQMSTMKKIVLCEIAIPNGTIADLKKSLDSFFDSLEIK